MKKEKKVIAIIQFKFTHSKKTGKKLFFKESAETEKQFFVDFFVCLFLKCQQKRDKARPNSRTINIHHRIIRPADVFDLL